MIKTVSSADTPAVRSRISQALAGYPNVLISDPNEFVRSEQASMDQVMGLVTALLALSIVVAALGIINTLALSVMERTREIGPDAGRWGHQETGPRRSSDASRC